MRSADPTPSWTLLLITRFVRGKVGMFPTASMLGWFFIAGKGATEKS
jgi:hypothetical protein